MIQRIQTVYLFIIAVIAALLLLFNPSYLEIQGYDKWTGNDKGNISVHFKSAEKILNETVIESANLSLMGYTLLVVSALAFIGIFLFKNRQLQMLLTSFNFIFILVLYVLMIFYGVKYHGLLSQEVDTEIAIGLFFPLFLPVFNYMALSRMNYDEQLLRGANRLR
jgi:hypothetical protein